MAERDLDREVDLLEEDAAARLPALCAPGARTARWIRVALSAGYVQGMRLGEEAHAPDGAGEFVLLAHDPAAQLTETELILYLLLGTLEGHHIDLPGAAALLRRYRRQRATDLDVPDRSDWERRSPWFAEGARWCLVLRRRGDDVQFLRRQRGFRDELVVTVSAEDSAAVLALLRLIGAAGALPN